MKKDEAKQLILREWSDWWSRNRGNKGPATGTDGLIFFGHIQSEKPHLLSFRAHDDPWQTVHGWLLSEKLVSD